jgi:aryl-alcohol dehydrogenase-like predicted oxidoreductase
MLRTGASRGLLVWTVVVYTAWRMRTRKLGRSGIDVGEIGLGTWPLSGEGYGPVDAKTARATLEAALDEGVTFVETAGCYGDDGAVEKMIGEVLRSRDRDRAFVSTRIGVDRAGPGAARKRFDKVGLTSLAEVSLKRLGTDRVDAFVLHNPLVETLRDPAHPAFDVLRALRDQGKTRTTGISVSTMDGARAAVQRGVDFIVLPYNLFYNKLLHEISGEASRSNVGIVAVHVLSFGVLAATWGSDRVFGEFDHRADRWSPAALARRMRQREGARYLIKGDVHDLREAAIRFALTNKLVSVAVVGARTPEHARANAHAADVLPYLPNEDLATISERMRELAL